MNRAGVTSVRLAGLAGAVILLTIFMSAGVATGGVAAQATNATNVTHHENPDSVDENGDSDRVRQWLSGSLTERLRQSSIQLSQGQYEFADGLIGEGFEERLGQFVDVAGETEGEDAAQDQANDFERAQENQQKLIEQRQAVARTYEEYKAARQRGDTETARRKARQLETLTEEIRQREQNLTQALNQIENQTGQNTDPIEQRIERVVQNVTVLQEEVRTETFVETTLTVSANDSVATFADPVAVRGRLQTANGTAIADRPIRLRVGKRLYEATTTANGTFVVTYRPVLVPADTDSVRVSYIPNATAPYLGTSANATVRIEQVRPTLTARVKPDRAAFGDTITVDVAVTVEGQPVPSVPIATTLAGRQLGDGQERTDATGVVQVADSISATDPVGNVSVRAGIERDDLAIGPANATTSFTIIDTSTNLSVAATARNDTFVVTGQLVALPDGQEQVGVPSQPVVVRVGDTTQTVRTDAAGQYTASFSRSAVPTTDETVRVKVTYDGDARNLDSANATTRLQIGNSQPAEADDGSQPGATGVSVPLTAVVGLGIVVLVGVGLFIRRRRGPASDGQPASEDTTDSIPDADEDTDDDGEWWLVDAQRALADGASEQAVVSAYAAVRTNLTDAFNIDDTSTSRELLARCQNQLDAESQTALATLVEAYEQAAFAPTLDDDAGRKAINAANILLDIGNDTANTTTGDD